ncbi:succinate dehydrogenase, partial [Streptomyces sp. SID6648]|nr:succinate dehydrogenase [Streptomyces sp. SID6648]
MSTTESPASGIGPVEGASLYTPDNPAPLIEPPRARTKKTPKSTRGNFEMVAWLFMRLSGVVLVVLVLGHLLIQLVLDGGVSKIGFAFVAGR